MGRVKNFFCELNLVSLLRIPCLIGRPVFITGCGRSGTTLLLSLLASHPDVYAIPYETRTYLRRKRHKRKWINKILFHLWFAAHLVKQKIPSRKSIWCEKTPRHVRHIAEMLNDFGRRARIIHIVRDGRDVVLSRHPIYGQNYVSIERWINDVKAGLAFEKHPQVLTIKYEALVLNPEKETQRISDFLRLNKGLDFVNFYIKTSSKEHNALFAPVQGLYSDSIGVWRKSSSTMTDAFVSNRDAYNLLMRLGYLEKDSSNNILEDE